MDKPDNYEWEQLSYEEKNRLLFQRQAKILELFLERGAISQEQRDKGMKELTNKMMSL